MSSARDEQSGDCEVRETFTECLLCARTCTKHITCTGPSWGGAGEEEPRAGIQALSSAMCIHSQITEVSEYLLSAY